MPALLDDFRDTWAHVRTQMTYDFIDAVPDVAFDSAPHPAPSAFAKQLRHLVCVHGVYLAGLRERTIDFSRKHSYYDGPLARGDLTEALRAMDAQTSAELDALAQESDAFVVDFFGAPRSLGRFLDTWIQHESLHHGQWSLYARLAGFDTPVSWQNNWSL